MNKNVTYQPILGPRMVSTIVYEHKSNARTNCYSISGATNKFQFPQKLGESLDCKMRYLVIQIFHKAGDHVTINLNISSANGAVFKFSFSTLERKNQVRSSKASTKILLDKIPSDKWVNVCFDLEYVVMKYWPGGTLNALQSIEIHPTCLIRWIFAMATQPLRPENGGSDVPNKFKLMGGIQSETILVAESNKRKSRIPLRSQGSKTKPPLTSSVEKPKRAMTVVPKSEQGNEKLSDTFGNDFEDDTESEEEDEDDAFLGKTAKAGVLAELNVKNGVPTGEEEELELVYIEALNCYYCPSNQQYYQIDD